MIYTSILELKLCCYHASIAQALNRKEQKYKMLNVRIFLLIFLFIHDLYSHVLILVN